MGFVGCTIMLLHSMDSDLPLLIKITPSNVSLAVRQGIQSLNHTKRQLDLPFWETRYGVIKLQIVPIKNFKEFLVFSDPERVKASIGVV